MRIAYLVSIGVLVLFLVSIMTEAQSTPQQAISVGYTAVESQKKAEELAQKLLTKKLAANVMIVPGVTSLRASEDSGEVQPTSTDQSQLLLIETRDELIKNVKAAIEGAYEGINVPQVLFSPVTGTPSYLDFIASRTGAKVSSAGVPLRKREEPSDRMVEETEEEISPEIDMGEEEVKEEAASQPVQKTVYLDQSTEFQVQSAVGESVQLLVQGNPTTGYMWTVDTAASSRSLVVGSFQPVNAGGGQLNGQMLVGAPTLFSLKVVPTEAGTQALTLRYARSFDPTDNPSVKVVHFNVL